MWRQEHLERFSAEEWRWALARAEQELGVVSRGRRGSLANRVRQVHGFRMYSRAIEIAYMRRVLGDSFGQEGK